MQTPSTTGENRHIRVMVVDDHPIIREALSSVIERQRDLEFCGDTGSADETIRAIKQSRPDVLVVDISLGKEDGLDLVEFIRLSYPQVRMIVYSMFDEHVYAGRAISAGASGYIMKSCATQEVIDAIRSVARGEIYLSKRMTSRTDKDERSGNRSAAFAIDELTDREMTVFQMLGRGLEIDEIASQLHLEHSTIEKYRRRLTDKLGFESFGKLILHAVLLKDRYGPVDRTGLPS